MDAAGIRFDPGNGIRSRFDAGANIKLQHHAGLCVLRENVHRPRADFAAKFRLMIVIARFQSRSFELLRCGVQSVRDGFPRIGRRAFVRTRHHDIFAAKNFVHFDCVANFVGAEIAAIVVRRIAADAEVVEKLAHFFGLFHGPLVVRAVKFEALVTGLGHFADGAHRVFGEGVSDGVHLDAHGDSARCCVCECGTQSEGCERCRCRKTSSRPELAFHFFAPWREFTTGLRCCCQSAARSGVVGGVLCD